jgi:hypothetical protein
MEQCVISNYFQPISESFVVILLDIIAQIIYRDWVKLRYFIAYSSI